MSYALIFGISLVSGLLLTPLARWLSFRYKVVAVPGGRRQHDGLMPKLGGIALFGAFMVGVIAIYRLLPPDASTNDPQLLRGVVIGSAVVFVGGLLDDWREQPAWSQFAIQLLATVIAFSFEVFLERFTNPLSGAEIPIRPYILVAVVTFIWISGMMNTVNMLDGLDGLAAGVGTIAALLFAWHSYNLGQYTIAAFPLALAGALLGFLPFNFAPARIYLGSAGAYLLGFELATLSILAPAKIATALLVMAVPIIDVAWQIFDRIRRGQSPFRGDRGHLHFRLSDGGLPTRPIVLGYYTIAALFGLVAIYAQGVQKLVALILLAVLVWILLLKLKKREKREKSL
ncbi:MAG: MraY family glycosyltransferase [Ardenticatenaceae bacterium]|nr:MraY family glycosyltransferase [Ardenticatenaceae bacterium]